MKYNLFQRRTSTVLKDFRGSALWVMDLSGQSLLAWFTTLFCRMMAWSWGIEIGTSCYFSGITEFKKYPTSTIRIGSNCSFRSDFRSNMVGINRPCGISTHTREAQIIIANKCGLSGTIIAAAKSIKLGEHVLCGANVLITDYDWHGVGVNKNSNPFESAKAIVIEDNVWIGINSVILKGSYIGENSIIGANSLVNSMLPSNVIAGGIPARVIRKL